MLAALANTTSCSRRCWLAEKPSPARALAAAAVGLLAIEARPDNVIIAFLCPLLALLLLAPAPRLRPLLLWAGTLAGLVLIDLTLKWRFLGTPLPLAFYAKQPWYYRGFVGEFTWNPFLFLEVALATVSPFLVAVVLFSRRASLRLLLVLLIPAPPPWPPCFPSTKSWAIWDASFPLAAALRGGGRAGHRPVAAGAAQGLARRKRASVCAIAAGPPGLRIARAAGRSPGSASRGARLPRPRPDPGLGLTRRLSNFRSRASSRPRLVASLT